jgi:hypothetical protein
MAWRRWFDAAGCTTWGGHAGSPGPQPAPPGPQLPAGPGATAPAPAAAALAPSHPVRVPAGPMTPLIVLSAMLVALAPILALLPGRCRRGDLPT